MGFGGKGKNAPAIFVGRSRELAELEALAADRSARLVTLWGPGGAGKTTLAKQCEASARARGANVIWADLSTSRTRRDVHAALAVALSVSLLDAPSDDEATEAIARAAAAQGALLIADNAEQLDAHARAVLVAIAEHEREGQEEATRVIVTSRDAFGVPLERAVAIDPLPEADALALFTALSGADADESAREIVRRLDALPLAIELAAARVPLLGSTELLARLDRKLDILGGKTLTSGDANHPRPERHATLRAAIAWSWDLLEPADRDALMTCATFEAPFDMALFESASGMGDEIAVMDAIERLRQRALLHVAPSPDEEGRPQIYMLEAVRDFARQEILRTAPGAEASAAKAKAGAFERHAQAIVDRTEPLAAIVRRGGAVPPALARRRADLLAASERRSARATLALAALLAITGPVDVIVERADACIVAARDDNERDRLTLAKALALRAMGRLAETEAALSTTITSAADARSNRDALLDADVMRVSGIVARSRGDSARAIELLSLARDRYRALGERAFAGICIGEIGAAHQSEGKIDLALARHAEAIAIHVTEKSIRAEGVERSYLAVATHRGGNPAAAVALHEAALVIHQRVGHRRLEGAELLHLGFVHHELGAPGPSRAAFTRARHVLAAAGARGLEVLATVLTARLDADEGDVEAARIALATASKHAPRGWPRLEATMHLIAGHLALGANGPSNNDNNENDGMEAVHAYEAALAASRDVEVGFEALTPAYLALAHARSGGSGGANAKAASSSTRIIDTNLASSRALVARVANPHIAEAFAILEAAALGKGAMLGSSTPEGVAASSEVRRALAFAGARLGIVLTDEARRLVLPDGRAIDLSRRKNVRLILLTLARARRDRPGAALTAEMLIKAGWPGERMRAEAATKRLHTAIWTLRSLGLEDVLVSSEDGYFLDPKLRMDVD